MLRGLLASAGSAARPGCWPTLAAAGYPRRVRIALVVESFEPAGGGVEQVVWKVAHGLAEAGDRVHVIARRGVDAPGVQLHRVAAPSFWQPIRVAAFARGAARRVRSGGPDGPFDVVHAFCRCLALDVFHAGGGSHADYMLHTYGPAGAAWRRLSPRHAVQLALERRIFRDPGAVIQCVSKMVAGEIARRFGVPDERLVVLYNGVDADRFDPARHAADRAALRAELACDGEPVSVWLLAGSGWRRKGLATALRALASCPDRTTRLWVAGSDAPAAWQAQARQLGVADRVRFLGARDDMERVYAAADGLLLPTRYDAFGLVCLEAAAAGLPVVTSAAAGAAELIGEAGAVVSDPDDHAAFAAALDRLADPERRRRLGELGRSIAVQHDWSRHVAQLRELYHRRRRS